MFVFVDLIMEHLAVRFIEEFPYRLNQEQVVAPGKCTFNSMIIDETNVHNSNHASLLDLVKVG